MFSSTEVIGESVEFIYCYCGCKLTRPKYNIDSKGRLVKHKPRKYIFRHSNKEKSKGDNITYKSMHKKMNKIYPKKEFCEMCELVPPDDLANITGILSLDVKHWMRMCHKCHYNFDSTTRKGWVTKKMRGFKPNRDPKTGRFIKP